MISMVKVALLAVRPPMHELGTHLSSTDVLFKVVAQVLIDLALLAAIYCECLPREFITGIYSGYR